MVSKCLHVPVALGIQTLRLHLNPISSKKPHRPFWLLGLSLEALKMNGSKGGAPLHYLKKTVQCKEPWIGICKSCILIPGSFMMLSRSLYTSPPSSSSSLLLLLPPSSSCSFCFSFFLSSLAFFSSSFSFLLLFLLLLPFFYDTEQNISFMLHCQINRKDLYDTFVKIVCRIQSAQEQKMVSRGKTCRCFYFTDPGCLQVVGGRRRQGLVAKGQTNLGRMNSRNGVQV